MKIKKLIEESYIVSNDIVAEDAYCAYEELTSMLEDVKAIREMIATGKMDESIEAEISEIISEMCDILGSDGLTDLNEAVKRQFKRYGDTFLRQYRCTTGPKAGRMAANAASCGKRKDPRKVRQGKKSARMKKGQRVRKTLFTKRKSQSKRLTRLNKVLRGDT